MAWYGRDYPTSPFGGEDRSRGGWSERPEGGYQGGYGDRSGPGRQRLRGRMRPSFGGRPETGSRHGYGSESTRRHGGYGSQPPGMHREHRGYRADHPARYDSGYGGERHPWHQGGYGGSGFDGGFLGDYGSGYDQGYRGASYDRPRRGGYGHNPRGAQDRDRFARERGYGNGSGFSEMADEGLGSRGGPLRGRIRYW